MVGSALPIHLSNSGFNVDSSGVRFGQYFWIIGGADFCMEKVGLAYGAGGIKSTYLWGIQKKKWFLGPNIHPDPAVILSYACPIVLNSTAILFIGLIKLDASSLLYASDSPNITMIFNFDTNAWTEQDSLDFTTKNIDINEYAHNPACAVDQQKTDKR